MDELAFIQGDTSASARNNPLQRKKTNPINGQPPSGSATPLSNVNSGRQWGNASAGVAAMKQMFPLTESRD
jgi:hypothetical protein